MPKDGVVTGVTLAIKNERLAIRGTVVDDTGATVPDVHVEAIGHDVMVTMGFASAMTDANGDFEVTNLVRGPYSLHAHAANGSEAEVLNIAAGTDHVTIKLPRPGAIEGTLVGFSTTPTVETVPLLADLHNGDYAIVDGKPLLADRPDARQVHGRGQGWERDRRRSGRSAPRRDSTRHSHKPGHGARRRHRHRARHEGTDRWHALRRQPIDGRSDERSPPDESRQTFTDTAGHFSLTTPTGRVRVFCFPVSGPPISPAGTDVDVSSGSVPHVDLFAVRPTFAGAPPKIGFDLVPLNLPITVNTVDPAGPAAAAGIVTR